MENIELIATLSVLIMVSPFLSRLTNSPVSVIEIILGACAGFLGFFSEGGSIFSVIANVGFLYLMFLAGLEVDLREFASLRKPMIKRITAYFILLYLISALLYAAFDFSPIYIAALPIVSIGMIVTLIHDTKTKQEYLTFALTLGIIGELISICALTVLSGLVQLGGLHLAFIQAMATLLFVLLAVWVFFRFMRVLFWWFPSIKQLIMPDSSAQDEDVRVSMALFFVLVAAVLYLELELVLGAFVAGMFIANFFKHKVDLPHKLSSFGFGFLVPIFFIFVGSTLDLRLIGQSAVLMDAALIFAAMLFMRLVASWLAFGKFFSLRERTLIGLTQSMPLTFLVAIATIGYNGKLLSHNEYSAFILASMLEAVFIMVVIRTLVRKTA